MDAAKKPTLALKELMERLAQAESQLSSQRAQTLPEGENAAATEDLVGLLRITRQKLAELHAVTSSPETEREGSLAGVQDLRRHLEVALRDAEDTSRTLNAILDTLPIGVIVADSDGRLIKTNRTGTEILGGQVLGNVENPQYPYPPCHPDGSHFSANEMPLARAVNKGEVSRNVELWLCLDEGQRIIVNADATPLRDSQGGIVGGVTIFRDVTEHRQREQAYERLLAQLEDERRRVAALAQTLKRERDVLEAIMENTQTHLAYLDRDFRFVRVNAAYAEGSGKTKEELLGEPHFKLFPNAENQVIFEKVRDTGVPVAFKAKPFTYADRPELGVTYWDWTLVPVKDEVGTVVGLVFSLLDVTEQQRAVAEVASIARFPDEDPNPVLRIDENGVLLYANAGSAPLRRDWGVAVGENVPLRWKAHVREAIRTQKTSGAEVRTGGRVYSLTVAPSPDGYANLYGLDVTDLRRAQSSLRQYAGRLRALHHIDQAILAAQSMEAIAEAALARLPQMIDCVRASVMLFDFETDEASLLAVYTVRRETQAGKGWHTPLTEHWDSVITQLRKGQSVLIDDVQALQPTEPLTVIMQQEGVRALLLQPMRAQGELIGALRLGLHQPGAISPRRLELARELADELAIAIEQARLHRQVQEHAEQLERRVVWRTAALRISEARFRAIFEDAPVGIALLDHEERIIQSNAALERILAVNAEALRDQRLSAYLVEEDRVEQSRLYQDLMTGIRESYRSEMRFIHETRQLIWCNVTVSLVRDVEHEPRLAIGMIEDITERREAQAAMVQTEKLALTGQLAASLAHEINNPLQTVIGCLGLADETLGGEEQPVRVYLQMASDELKRAAGIVGRLRELNRPPEAEDKKTCSLQDLVERVLAVTGKQCRDRGVAVDLIHEDGSGPQVTVIPDRIQQVFLNLVLNAIDAMPNGGRLTISLTKTDVPQGGQVVFRDTGVGIPPEIQARLFDPFHTTKPDGLGLGLFISQSIIQDHGGHIKVESTPGEGTTFTIWLPS